jgi:hypothetical protein
MGHVIVVILLVWFSRLNEEQIINIFSAYLLLALPNVQLILLVAKQELS